MTDKRRHALPIPQKKTTDAPDVIWGEVHSTYETQAISDDSERQHQTGVAIPADSCVEDGKEWVDFNKK